MSDRRDFDLVKVSETLREAESLSAMDNFGVLLRLIEVFSKDKVHFEYLVHSIICIQQKKEKFVFPHNMLSKILSDGKSQSILNKIIGSYCEIFSYKNSFLGTSNSSVLTQVYDYNLWSGFKQMLGFLEEKEILSKDSKYIDSLFHELIVSSYKHKDSLEKCLLLPNEYNPFHYFLEEKKVVPISAQFIFYCLDTPYIPLLDKLLDNGDEIYEYEVLKSLISGKNIFAPILFDRMLGKGSFNSKHLDAMINLVLFNNQSKHFLFMSKNISFSSHMSLILDKHSISNRIKFKSSELSSNQFIVPYGFLTTIHFMPKEPVINLLLSRLDDKANLIICFNPKKTFHASGIKNVFMIPIIYDENFFIELLPKLSNFLQSYSQDLANPDIYSQAILERAVEEIINEIKRQYLVYSL